MLIGILLVCSVLCESIGDWQAEEECFDRVKMHIDLKIYVTGEITDVFE